jgi:hypothetical protein
MSHALLELRAEAISKREFLAIYLLHVECGNHAVLHRASSTLPYCSTSYLHLNLAHAVLRIVSSSFVAIMIPASKSETPAKAAVRLPLAHLVAANR